MVRLLRRPWYRIAVADKKALDYQWTLDPTEIMGTGHEDDEVNCLAMSPYNHRVFSCDGENEKLVPYQRCQHVKCLSIFWLTERDFIYLLFMFVSFLLNRTQLLDSFHQLFTASSLNPEQKEIATARTEFFAYSIPDETEEVSLLFPLKLNIHNSNR